MHPLEDYITSYDFHAIVLMFLKICSSGRCYCLLLPTLESAIGHGRLAAGKVDCGPHRKISQLRHEARWLIDPPRIMQTPPAGSTTVHMPTGIEGRLFLGSPNVTTYDPCLLHAMPQLPHDVTLERRGRKPSPTFHQHTRCASMKRWSRPAISSPQQCVVWTIGTRMRTCV